MIKFVGAGPGDKELITVKGMNALKSAGCIIYAGSLVNDELLDYASEDCDCFNSAFMTLEEVVVMMKKYYLQGKSVVRLHTGDPSIYGAIREQIDLLIEDKINYEVIPGVSSFLGAAASIGAEYTLPGVTQTVILTRMEGRTKVPKKEKISSLANIGASMAIFLSAKLLKELVEELLLGGYSDDTKACIIYKATWKDEKIIHTTVNSLYEDAKKANITKTALILVGDFLGNRYERSKLYDSKFSHEFRSGSDE
ncbi:MAG: precorrin-4 C(11)-methyltransferase [Bacilli bacterium]